MDVDDLAIKMTDRLRKHPLSPKYVLSQFKLNNEDYRLSSEYTDPTHYPIYYYLGRHLQTKNLIEFGFESGLEAGCFLHGCKTVEKYLGFKHKTNINYWSPRIPSKNVLNVLKKPVNYWYGEIVDPEFLKQVLVRKWDCALMVRSETKEINRRYLDLVWGQMSLGGIMIVDRIKSNSEMKSAFEDFCKVVHRPLTVLKSRYGIGLVIR
jgi:hypothetical protein